MMVKAPPYEGKHTNISETNADDTKRGSGKNHYWTSLLPWGEGEWEKDSINFLTVN